MSTDTGRNRPARADAAAMRELFGFVRPLLRPSRPALVSAASFGLVSLVAAAMVPLLLERLLNRGFTSGVLALMVGLMVTDALCNYRSRRASSIAAVATAQRLSERVYASALTSPMLRQEGLRRPSVVSRHTSDVDRVEEALDQTLTDGLPAVAQIILSTGLLFYVEPKVGVAMVVATLLFLLVNRSIGRRVLTMDRERLDSSSDVGAVVDESITNARTVSGFGLETWMSQRFGLRAARLRDATERQRLAASRIFTAARASAHLALLGVVLIAFLGGRAEAGAIAASLLYINSTVAGLERLPGWLRSTRLAVASKRRIERITLAPSRVTRESAQRGADSPTGLSTDGVARSGAVVEQPLSVARGSLVSVVAGPDQPLTDLLAVLSGDLDPSAGSVQLDGIDVRHPLAQRRITLISDDHYLMDESTMAHLRAVDPYVTVAEARALLGRVGLGHLEDMPGGGLDAALGTLAERLGVHERQRLKVAMAALGSSDVIVADRLAVLADPDGAAPLIDEMRVRPDRIVILPANAPELAERSDLVITWLGGTVVAGRHADLMADAEYLQLWQRLQGEDLDERLLSFVPESQRGRMRARITTESFSAGETVFRAGSPADRVIYVVAGRILISEDRGGSGPVRVADVGPGHFCGDVSDDGAVHRLTARAEQDTVVRSLAVETWSAGLLGLLDASGPKRRALTAVLRTAPPTREAIEDALGDDPAARESLDDLVASGLIAERPDGLLTVRLRRRASTLPERVLDRLGE